MNDKELLKLSKSVISMKCSLDYALTRAGGDPSYFNAETLERISALELLAALAPNGIRFHYQELENDKRSGQGPLR